MTNEPRPCNSPDCAVHDPIAEIVAGITFENGALVALRRAVEAGLELAAERCDERARAHQWTMDGSPGCDYGVIRKLRDEAEKCARAIRGGR